MSKIIDFPNRIKKAFQLKLTIKDSNPVIWRRLIVSEDFELDYLHCAIQCVFDWEDEHLYEFQHKGNRLAFEEDIDVLDANQYILKDLSLQKSDNFTYIYDIGDDWTIEIEVEDNLIFPENKQLPFYVNGENPPPPEDFGGIHIYNDFYSKFLKNEEIDPILLEEIKENINYFNRNGKTKEYNDYLIELGKFDENLANDLANYSDDSDFYDD